MSTEVCVTQGSEEWHRLRMTRITSSLYPKLMPSKYQKIDQWNDTQLSILRGIAAQRLTGEREDAYISSAMQWGIDYEHYAREALSAATGLPVRESGFWIMDDFTGSSPDGIMGFCESVCEIKCPSSKQHLRYVLDMGEWVRDYGWQIKHQMWCTELYHGCYASYDPRYPDGMALSYKQISLRCDDIDMLVNRTGHAVDLIKEWTNWT